MTDNLNVALVEQQVEFTVGRSPRWKTAIRLRPARHLTYWDLICFCLLEFQVSSCRLPLIPRLSGLPGRRFYSSHYITAWNSSNLKNSLIYQLSGL